MTKFKVLIAEDTIEARDILIEEIRKLKERTGYEFEYTECEFPDKALNKLSELEQKNEYYDILFIDLDFTQQAHKGGKRDSGFQIIKKAFEICPISKICTYSGQFREVDLSEEHQELIKKGLVVYTFDKSKKEAGHKDWFEKGILEIIEELKQESFLFDIFNNHKLIKSEITKSKLPLDIQWEILSNLDSIINLSKNLNKVPYTYIYLRLIIHLYHLSLISYLRNLKSDEEIKRNFEAKKAKAIEIIKPSKTFEWREQNALSIIIGEGNIDFVKFGFKLNDYRNKCIHPEPNFNPDLFNIIFCSLVFSLYVIQDKQKLHISRIEVFLENFDEALKGKKDLVELLTFLRA